MLLKNLAILYLLDLGLLLNIELNHFLKMHFIIAEQQLSVMNISFNSFRVIRFEPIIDIFIFARLIGKRVILVTRSTVYTWARHEVSHHSLLLLPRQSTILQHSWTKLIHFILVQLPQLLNFLNCVV